MLRFDYRFVEVSLNTKTNSEGLVSRGKGYRLRETERVGVTREREGGGGLRCYKGSKQFYRRHKQGGKWDQRICFLFQNK